MGFHWWDIAIVAALGLLFFGPKRLPEIGSSIGKTIREFQKSMREVTDMTSSTSVPPSTAQPVQPLAAPTTVPTLTEPASTVAAPADTATSATTDVPVQEDAVR
jgi:sec-independent protein translocase protein TatA